MAVLQTNINIILNNLGTTALTEFPLFTINGIDSRITGGGSFVDDSNNFSSLPLYLMSRSGSLFFSKIRLYFLAIVGEQVSDQNINACNTYMTKITRAQ